MNASPVTSRAAVFVGVNQPLERIDAVFRKDRLTVELGLQRDLECVTLTVGSRFKHSPKRSERHVLVRGIGIDFSVIHSGGNSRAFTDFLPPFGVDFPVGFPGLPCFSLLVISM